ncbi:hypothetical protein LCGC14_1231910, partial [marine sediment metagenome]
MASRAAGHAKRLHISVSLCEAAARIDAALADSADAPPVEPTEEMVEAGATRLHTRWGYIFFHDSAELSNRATRDILRAALAAAQKEG